MNQGGGALQTWNLLPPRSWISQPPELLEINVCLSHPACYIFMTAQDSITSSEKMKQF